jgi:hypothetical protein
MQVAPRVLEVQQARWGTTNQRSQYGIDLFLLLKYQKTGYIKLPNDAAPPRRTGIASYIRGSCRLPEVERFGLTAWLHNAGNLIFEPGPQATRTSIERNKVCVTKLQVEVKPSSRT